MESTMDKSLHICLLSSLWKRCKEIWSSHIVRKRPSQRKYKYSLYAVALFSRATSPQPSEPLPWNPPFAKDIVWRFFFPYICKVDQGFRFVSKRKIKSKLLGADSQWQHWACVTVCPGFTTPKPCATLQRDLVTSVLVASLLLFPVCQSYNFWGCGGPVQAPVCPQHFALLSLF